MPHLPSHDGLMEADQLSAVVVLAVAGHHSHVHGLFQGEGHALASVVGGGHRDRGGVDDALFQGLPKGEAALIRS